MSTHNRILAYALATVAFVTAALATYVFLPDLVRGFTILQTIFTGSTCVYIAVEYSRRLYRSPHDPSLWHAVLLSLGTMGLCLYVGDDIVGKLREPLSYKTPLAFTTFTLLNLGLVTLLWRVIRRNRIEGNAFARLADPT